MRRANGLSVESSNHYLRRTKQFAAWMAKTGRASSSPLACLKLMNAQTDRRHDRRAFTDDELRRLLATARKSRRKFRMCGLDRAMLYRLAAETGLRAREIGSLTPESFLLDEDPAGVVVAAGYSKHRREDVQPIPPTLRADLADARDSWIAEASTDEERKAREQSSFLVYQDDTDRVLDFHAFRHTFITNLARGGVHPKIAQQLARHSTITLTMDRYTHTALGETAATLSVLPDLSGPRPDGERLRATGTCDDRSADMSSCMSESRTSRGLSLASSGMGKVEDAGSTGPCSAAESGSTGPGGHFSAPNGITGVDGNRTHHEPRKRPVNGFEGRGTHQASGHPQRIRIATPSGEFVSARVV